MLRVCMLGVALVVLGVDPLLRLFQRLALHQQHHELKFWGDEDIEKAIGGEADMVSAWRSIFPLVRRGRLPLITCSDPPVVHVGEQRKSSLKSSLSPWSLSSEIGSEVSKKVFRFVDPVILHFLPGQALVDMWATESCKVETVEALFDRKRC